MRAELLAKSQVLAEHREMMASLHVMLQGAKQPNTVPWNGGNE